MILDEQEQTAFELEKSKYLKFLERDERDAILQMTS